MNVDDGRSVFAHGQFCDGQGPQTILNVLLPKGCQQLFCYEKGPPFFCHFTNDVHARMQLFL